MRYRFRNVMATTSIIKTVHPKNRLFAAGLSRTGLRIFQTGANYPGRAGRPPRIIVAPTKILISCLFQEWGRIFEVGPVGIRLSISVFTAGPIGPVGLVPADEADISIGGDAGHVPDSFLEAPDAHLDDLLGVEGIGLAQLLDDGVHLWTRPARVKSGLVAFSNGLYVGRVPIVERAIQIGTRTPWFPPGPYSVHIKVAGGCQISGIFRVKNICIDTELLPLLHGSHGIAG